MRPQNKFDRGVEARRHARNTAAKPGATKRIENAREAEERRLAQEEIKDNNANEVPTMTNNEDHQLNRQLPEQRACDKCGALVNVEHPLHRCQLDEHTGIHELSYPTWAKIGRS